MKFHHLFESLVCSLLIVFVSGCDATSSNDLSETSVKLNIVANPGAVSKSYAAKNASAALQLTSVKILLRTIQFHKRDDESDENSDEDSLEFKTDPIVASLNLGGTPTELTVADIPSGSYHKVSFRIHKPEEDETPPDLDFKVGTGGNERFSVIVEGMFDGQPFTYRSSKSMQQQVEFNPDLVIDENTTDVTVDLGVDMSAWFTSPQGEMLDPTDRSSGNTSLIDKSIRDSFRVFRDDNEDGEDDEAGDD